MARTALLSKKQIVEAAFDLMNQNGMSALTIRSIAKHLGKSTAPIYTQYEGFDAIMDDLRLFVKDKILTYTSGSYTGDAFLDIGVGLIVFALENKNVYTHFFSNG